MPKATRRRMLWQADATKRAPIGRPLFYQDKPELVFSVAVVTTAACWLLIFRQIGNQALSRQQE